MEPCCVLELWIIDFFSPLLFLIFYVLRNDLTWKVIVIFLGLKRLKSHDLGLKQHILGVKLTTKKQKCPRNNCCRSNRRPQPMSRRSIDGLLFESARHAFTRMGITFY